MKLKRYEHEIVLTEPLTNEEDFVIGVQMFTAPSSELSPVCVESDSDSIAEFHESIKSILSLFNEALDAIC